MIIAKIQKYIFLKNIIKINIKNDKYNLHLNIVRFVRYLLILFNLDYCFSELYIFATLK